MQKNLGGDRLGSGAKMDINLHGFERSNHDLSYLWKSTMAPGTLVPFMNILGLPGDTFDIELDSLVKTTPTIGPLFGSMKLQLDVFTVPIRLYNRILHNNKLNLGLEIANVKFPQLALTGDLLDLDSTTPIEFQQINQSSIFAYLGIRGLGDTQARSFNAIPFLGYWDIFKNYYANKQEENAYVIHSSIPSITAVTWDNLALPQTIDTYLETLDITGNNITFDNVQLALTLGGATIYKTLREFGFNNDSLRTLVQGKHLQIWVCKYEFQGFEISASRINPDHTLSDLAPTLTSFPLANLDTMRDNLLGASTSAPYVLNHSTLSPYGLPMTIVPTETNKMYAVCGQEGLAVKTYQSDIFNNWINTETQTNIATISAVSTAGGSFTIDTLNLSKKVYDMLNRIAVSGGSYEDWLEAVFDHTSKWRAEAPIYHGGLSKEIVFQEVVSVAATANEPLGSLAGRGTMSQKHKGGKIIINVDEPSYIMGIVSITPRVSYSQGNDWTTNLLTMDDLHKPSLDGIGFQDLIEDQMHFASTYYTLTPPSNVMVSAGKQPAWLNYMTNYDKNYGNFADPRSQQFMTLDRRYEIEHGSWATQIKDLTTYIDPAKFNYAFAEVDLSAQNFWVQIANNIHARRKISAKIIPNL